MKKLLSIVITIFILAFCAPFSSAQGNTEIKTNAYSKEGTEKSGSRLVIDNYQLGYTGEWNHYRSLDTIGYKGYYRDTASSTQNEGTAFDYTFASCTRIYWFANYNPAYAIVDIYLDGQFIQTLNCGALGTVGTPSLVWASPELPLGTHTLKVVRQDTPKNKNKYFEVDRLEADGDTGEHYLINNTHTFFFNYVFGFEIAQFQGALNDDVHISNTPDSWLISTFMGSYVTLFGNKGPNYGRCAVFLDGEPIQIIDCYNIEEKTRQPLLTISDLKDGYHSLKLVVLPKNEKSTGNNIAIDYIETNHPYNASTEIFHLGKEALEKMENGTKEYIPPQQWQPVSPAALVPQNGITLKDGLFKQVFSKNIRYLKASALLPSYVTQTTVWTDNFPSANEGRMLAGAANSLRWIEDAALEKIVKDLLQTAKARQKPNGYCLPEPEEWYNGLFLNPTNQFVSVDECKNYGRVMYTQGLVAAGKAGYADAYQLLRELYDWLNNCSYKKYLLPGSLGIQGILGGSLAYTSPVGKPEDIITNMLFYEMDWYLDYLGAAMPVAMYLYPLDRPHSYMATAACAFLDMYGATGDEKYLQAGLGAYVIFSEYYETTGGGICMCEGEIFTPGNYKLSSSPRGVYETCNNVLWTDLNHKLLQYFPTDEKYAAAMERSLINILFAAQNDSGAIRYFNHMTGKKEAGTMFNTCCEVQACRQIGQLPQFIYSYNDNNVYVNLYAASEYKFFAGGAKGTLIMDTAFPYSQDVKITLSLQKEGEFTLNLRIPSWCAADKVDILLNGELAAKAAPGTYYALNRQFKDGDVITFSLPMEFKATKYVGISQIEGKVRYGIQYGPILMALMGDADPSCIQPGGEAVANLSLTPTDLYAALEPVNDKLMFKIKGAQGYYLVPYNAVGDNTEFTCFPVLLEEIAKPAPQTPEPIPTPTLAPDTNPPKKLSSFALALIIGIPLLSAGASAIFIISKKTKN